MTQIIPQISEPETHTVVVTVHNVPDAMIEPSWGASPRHPPSVSLEDDDRAWAPHADHSPKRREAFSVVMVAISATGVVRIRAKASATSHR